MLGKSLHDFEPNSVVAAAQLPLKGAHIKDRGSPLSPASAHRLSLLPL